MTTFIIVAAILVSSVALTFLALVVGAVCIGRMASLFSGEHRKAPARERAALAYRVPSRA